MAFKYVTLKGLNTFKAQIISLLNTKVNKVNGEGLSNYIIGSQTSASSLWLGTTSKISSLFDGLRILYKLPYNSSSDNVTLNLTLSDSSTTGGIFVYLSPGVHVTNQFVSGNIIPLTYVTSDSAWYCDGAFASSSKTVYLTKTEYDALVSAGTVDSDTLYYITG